MLKPLLSVWAVLSLISGVFWVAAPAAALRPYGYETLSSLETILARYTGSLFIGLAVLAWFARGAEASQARNALVLGLTVLNIVAAVVAVWYALAGVVPNAGTAWAPGIMHTVFAVLFIVAGRKSMAVGAPAGAAGV